MTAIIDEIDRCAARAFGIELAVQAICADHPGPLYEGVARLVQDLRDALRDVSERMVQAMQQAEARADVSLALAALIEAHKSAYAKMKAEGDADDGESQQDDDAALAVALAPVTSQAELMAKLRYLLNYEIGIWGPPKQGTEFGLVAIALDAFLNPKRESAASLGDLIEAHRTARAAFDLAVDADDDGTPPTPEKKAAWSQASTAEQAAALALCSYRCATLEEARVKAAYCLDSQLVMDGIDQAGYGKAFMASFADAARSPN